MTNKEFTASSGEAKPNPAGMAPLPDPSSYTLAPFQCFPFYPFSADRNQMFSTFDNLPQQVHPGAGYRWPGAEYPDAKAWMDPMYNMSFNLAPPTLETYPVPVDPCPSNTPSTSMAQPAIEYKQLDYGRMIGNPMNTAYAYNNQILPAYADFATTQAFTANWKTAIKGTNSSKNGIPPPKHRTGPGTNNVRVRTQDTYRVVYTDAQRTELELEYQTQQFITSERKAELSGRLNLTERQVKIWFQNRRAKDRREKRNTPSKMH